MLLQRTHRATTPHRNIFSISYHKAQILGPDIYLDVTLTYTSHQNLAADQAHPHVPSILKTTTQELEEHNKGCHGNLA